MTVYKSRSPFNTIQKYIKSKKIVMIAVASRHVVVDSVLDNLFLGNDDEDDATAEVDCIKEELRLTVPKASKWRASKGKEERREARHE